MEYPFWINDFNRISNYQNDYPLALNIFKYPQSFWYLDNPKKPKTHMEKSIHRLLNRTHPQLPILVIYNIPNRDVGQWSKGGAKSREDYIDFIHRFARGVGNKSPIIIYEPDALPHSTLMNKADKEWRLDLMRESLEILTKECNGIVYIDIGHPAWLKPYIVNRLLTKVSNDKVRGFSVNSCNYRTTEECLKWSDKICKLRPDDYFVIDTSRNGNGSLNNEWCNPHGRALGVPPTTDTPHKKCDAYLWIKVPGESDGKCNKGPRAGKFWPDIAVELVKNSLNK